MSQWMRTVRLKSAISLEERIPLWDIQTFTQRTRGPLISPCGVRGQAPVLSGRGQDAPLILGGAGVKPGHRDWLAPTSQPSARPVRETGAGLRLSSDSGGGDCCHSSDNHVIKGPGFRRDLQDRGPDGLIQRGE
ncbi:unnamed protein product [Pleuronectes platessa]|uniref:Uncharacterized protein n=1 Tax=Pleuronectes platessa TaxID=8262 RepID=A0A9N7Z8I2_PLEPL|nr:unnamed protein product [Pleuronectes platessa]